MTAFQNLQSTLWTLTIRNAREAARLYFEPMVSGLRVVEERRASLLEKRRARVLKRQQASNVPPRRLSGRDRRATSGAVPDCSQSSATRKGRFHVLRLI